MRKSIYSYWSVFCLRYVDNLHQRIKYNLLFDFADRIRKAINSKYSPTGISEYSGRVKEWMSEPKPIARKREELTTALEKIDMCVKILNGMGRRSSQQVIKS